MNKEKKIRIKRKNKNKGFKKKYKNKIVQIRKYSSTNTKSPLSKLILHNYLNCKLREESPLKY